MTTERDPLAVLVGGQIKKAREPHGDREKKFTQRDLAVLLDVRENDVRRWETGRNLPQTHRIPELAAALGVDPNYLFGIE